MASIQGNFIGLPNPNGWGPVAPVKNDYFSATQFTPGSGLTLRQAIIIGQAQIEAWLAKYPLEVVFRACIEANVDVDRTRVVLLTD